MRRLLAALATVLVTLGFATLPAAAETRNPHSAVPVYLVMDVSGSMEGQRLQAAQAAARSFITGLQSDQVFALYTFPGSRKMVDGCPAGRFNIRPARVNQGNAQFAVNLLSATGNTPTVPALKEIMRNVKNNGYENAQVVLVTDGEANCGESNDVCSVVPMLDQQGIKLRIHTVSLNNTPDGDASLACLARGTGGTSTTVDDVAGLVDAVRRASSYGADLDVSLPATLPRVTGRSRDLAAEMKVKVTATGSALIPDASLVVTFHSGDAARRIESEPLGTIPLGNLDVGASVEKTLLLYPMATADGPVTWKASLVAGGVPVASETGTVRLTSGTTVASGGRIFSEAKSVVIMGDSYSSGEGAGDYDSSMPHREWWCHRSAKAYGRVLFPDAAMVACSGAVYDDWAMANDNRNSGSNSMGTVKPQLLQLLELTASDNPPDLVLMTLGGNDVGFGQVVTDYMLNSTADDAPPTRPAIEWRTLGARIKDAYKEVNAVVNAPVAIAKREGKIAQVVVLPYVRPIPAAGGAGCFLWISPHELTLANQFVGELNKTVREAVAAAAADGVPVQLASPVEYAFLPDHTLCDGDDTYINPLRWEGPASAVKIWYHKSSPAAKQELMHPNAAGHAYIAASLVEWSRTVEPLDLTAHPADYRDLKVWPAARGGMRRVDTPTTLGAAGPALTLPNIVTEPGQSVDVSLCIEQCEFATVYVTVTVNSLPIPLGALPVNPDTRRPEGFVTLPPDLAPGTHTIVLRGLDEAGNPHEASFEVRVWRTGTSRGLHLAAAGGALLLVAGGLWVVGWLRGRSRR